jgi:chemotaxis protein MotA
MAIVPPVLGAIIGAAVWFSAKQALEQAFGSQTLAGHLLMSPINLFSFAAFSAAAMIMYHRRRWISREDRWTHLGLLPEGEDFLSFASVEPFSKSLAAQGPRRDFRPLRLLRACFESVRRNWTVAAAHQALKTEFDLMRAEAEAHYYVVTYLVGAIVSIGFVGTVYGIGQSMGEIGRGTEAAIAQLHVAFDTTLVALVLSLIASLALSSLQKLEDAVLVSAFDRVFHDFVLRIRERPEGGTEK